MRRFLVHLLGFAAIQAVVLAWAWQRCPTDPQHYMAATIDKHARLDRLAPPRLIFVGGSSVAFGIDSRAFQGLALAPVNMGLNDGLGLGFMLAEVAGALGPGDVVVLAPETHLYWTGSRDDAISAALQHRPASLACLSGRDLREVSDQGLHFLARKLRCAAHQMSMGTALATIYRRSSFDELGDFVAHRDLPRRAEPVLDPPFPPLNPAVLEAASAELRAFAQQCRRTGARCFLAWSPTRRARYEQERAAFAVLQEALGSIDLPMLESPADATFPEESFFDRGPHLTGEAARLRSARLAARLEAALASPP